jgi:hypothetical protein
MSTIHRGGCLCGAIRYAITGAPVVTTLCHCRSCRLASGAPSLAWTVVRVDDLRYDAGHPSEFESSPGVFRGFCRACGTSLSWRRLDRPDTIDLTTASLDAPDAFAPAKEIWLEHKLAWETAHPRLPHYARSSVGAAPLSAAPGDDTA